MHASTNKHGDLVQQAEAAIRDVYAHAGMLVTQTLAREEESTDYGACRFGLDGRNIVFRVAKTTPNKLGQFVTLWKRPAPGAEIAPLDSNDGIDFVVVNVASAAFRGQFVFGRELLLDKGVMSRLGKGGKRALRVYPPWITPTAKTAILAQAWQLQCFLPFTDQGHAASAEQLDRLFARN